jgi:hypothetical protein
MKPVELLRKLIANSTKTGEWVYDPFLGSGSTLIACEHLGRRCLGIELDEGYVKTAVARWEKLTGLKAVLMDSGENHATTSSHVKRLKGKAGCRGEKGFAGNERVLLTLFNKNFPDGALKVDVTTQGEKINASDEIKTLTKKLNEFYRGSGQ